MMDNGFRASAARERLGLTIEGLAAELAVSDAEVAAWEAGAVPVPALQRRRIEYLLACSEWNAGMAASGLPPCEWVEARIAQLHHDTDPHASALLARDIGAHAERCATCRARATWAGANLPPVPTPPTAGVNRPFQLVQHGVSRLPAWARPAAWSAIALALMTAVRLLMMLPRVVRSPLDALDAVGVLLLAGAGGGVGGLAYSATRRTLGPLGAPGDYLAGILCTVAYTGTIAMITALTGTPMISDAPSFWIFLSVSVLFGVVVGKMINEHTRAG